MTDAERNKTEPREHKVTNPYSGASEVTYNFFKGLTVCQILWIG